MNKVISLELAMTPLKDGSTILIGGFLGIGSPLCCIQWLVDSGLKNLTLIAIVNSYPGGEFDLAPLFANHQVSKLITAHTGTCPEALALYKAGELEIEFYPMGTLIEKVRCGGYGLGGVLTTTGVGTLMEEGKQKLTVGKETYLVETALRADVAFIKGYQADAMGNVSYRGAAQNSNLIWATAAQHTIAEVNEILPTGGIPPQNIGTPGIFVDCVIQGNTLEQQDSIIKNLWVDTQRLVV